MCFDIRMTKLRKNLRRETSKISIIEANEWRVRTLNQMMRKSRWDQNFNFSNQNIEAQNSVNLDSTISLLASRLSSRTHGSKRTYSFQKAASPPYWTKWYYLIKHFSKIFIIKLINSKVPNLSFFKRRASRKKLHIR